MRRALYRCATTAAPSCRKIKSPFYSYIKKQVFDFFEIQAIRRHQKVFFLLLGEKEMFCSKTFFAYNNHVCRGARQRKEEKEGESVYECACVCVCVCACACACVCACACAWVSVCSWERESEKKWMELALTASVCDWMSRQLLCARLHSKTRHNTKIKNERLWNRWMFVKCWLDPL